MWRLVVSGGLFSILMLGSVAMSDPQTEASIQFVGGLDANCAFDDGYACVEPITDDFLFSQDKMVSGAYLPAWAVAYADFSQRDDLSNEQKKLVHYKIGMTETESDFLIVFRALLLPQVEGGKPKGVLRTTLGQSMRYLVSKDELVVREVKFYR